MSTTSRPRILVAPLDWGLGHTSRCVPLIRHLKARQCEVLLAGNREQLSYYQKEFPTEVMLHLDGYNVSYARKSAFFMGKILGQVPRLAKVLDQEHRWLMDLASKERISGIISDNRYGLWHPRIPSVITTHQLQPLSGMGRLADALARRMHYRLLGKFNACWVVDVPGIPNLSGRLAHPATLPRVPLSYLGWLTHLPPVAQQPGSGAVEYEVLILLSGPEPQRSILSERLWQQAEQLAVPVCFVEGSTKAPQRIPTRQGLQWYGRVGSEELRQLILESGQVVCRSGYSTVMDLMAIGRRGLFIPTPGQTEQEYLARHLAAQGIGLSYAQDRFRLQDALEEARTLPLQVPAASAHEAYKEVLDHWLRDIGNSG